MTDSSTESSLLFAARNGDVGTVKSLLKALNEHKLSFELNCTGMWETLIACLKNIYNYEASSHAD